MGVSFRKLALAGQDRGVGDLGFGELRSQAQCFAAMLFGLLESPRFGQSPGEGLLRCRIIYCDGHSMAEKGFR